jgi:hypothetical protein
VTQYIIHDYYMNVVLLLESWLLVDKGLAVLFNCSTHRDQTALTRLRQECLDTDMLQLAQHSDPVLVYRCVQLAGCLDVTERLPSFSPDVIAVWVAWLSTFYYNEVYKGYHIELPGLTATLDTVGGLFDTLHKVTVNDEQRCALSQALKPHSRHIQQVLIRGDDLDKEWITEVLEDFLQHTCSQCDLGYLRDIMVKSGQSIQDVLQLKQDTSPLMSRFTWIASLVFDTATCFSLATTLGVSHKQVRRFIKENGDIPVAITTYILNTWAEQTQNQNEADRWEQLIEAVGVIEVM